MMKCRWSPPTIVVLLMIHWSAVLVHAGSIICNDPELCLSKRFLRFGRGLSPDPYYRISRQFFRLNRSYQPYQDKRFLRFGRSQLPNLDDIYTTDVSQPYNRKRRSLDTDTRLAVTHDTAKRSPDQSAIEKPGNDEMSKMIEKRSVDEKRFMRFGRDFVRNDDKADIDDDTSQFSKRFMRFGKSLIPAKRFMRFGRDHGVDPADDILMAPLAETSKRFMRFGKRANIENNEDEDVEKVLEEAKLNSLSKVLSLANRLKSETGELDGNLYSAQKRFMRFGKRDAETDDLVKES